MTSPVEHEGSAAAHIAASPAKDVPGAKASAAVPPLGAAPVSGAAETAYKPVVPKLTASPGPAPATASFAAEAGTAIPLGVTAPVDEPASTAHTAPAPDTNRVAPLAPDGAVPAAHDRGDTVHTREPRVASTGNVPTQADRVRITTPWLTPPDLSSPNNLPAVSTHAADPTDAQLVEDTFNHFVDASASSHTAEQMGEPADLSATTLTSAEPVFQELSKTLPGSGQPTSASEETRLALPQASGTDEGSAHKRDDLSTTHPLEPFTDEGLSPTPSAAGNGRGGWDPPRTGRDYFEGDPGHDPHGFDDGFVDPVLGTEVYRQRRGRVDPDHIDASIRPATVDSGNGQLRVGQEDTPELQAQRWAHEAQNLHGLMEEALTITDGALRPEDKKFPKVSSDTFFERWLGNDPTTEMFLQKYTSGGVDIVSVSHTSDNGARVHLEVLNSAEQQADMSDSRFPYRLEIKGKFNVLDRGKVLDYLADKPPYEKDKIRVYYEFSPTGEFRKIIRSVTAIEKVGDSVPQNLGSGMMRYEAPMEVDDWEAARFYLTEMTGKLQGFLSAQ